MTASTMPTQGKGIPAMNGTSIWIGRADVRPLPHNQALGAARGAIVNVLGLADTEAEFLQILESAMSEYGFEILLCEDVARLSDWLSVHEISTELNQLAARLTSEFPVQFDEFQSYVFDDA